MRKLTLLLLLVAATAQAGESGDYWSRLRAWLTTHPRIIVDPYRAPVATTQPRIIVDPYRATSK